MVKSKGAVLILLFAFLLVVAFIGCVNNNTAKSSTQNSIPQLTMEKAREAGMRISAGKDHYLAVNGKGAVIAWGNNLYGACDVPVTAKSDIVAVAAGNQHSLALKSDGTVVGWGDNQYGQAEAPSDVQRQVIAIAANEYDSFVLKSDGSVVAWGYNDRGQCDVPIQGQSAVTAISTGFWNTDALKSDGSVISWGDSNLNERSINKSTQKDIIAFTSGFGLKANGSVVPLWAEVDVPGDAQNDIVAIASHGLLGCLALKADGRLIYWGYSYNEKTGREEPVQSIIANTQDDVVGISDGMILKSDGTVLFYDIKEDQFTELSGVNLGPLPEFAVSKKVIPRKHDGKISTSIKITIGEKTAYVNGKPYTLDVAPFLDAQTGQALIPLGFFADALGVEVVFWNTSKDGKSPTIVTDGQTEIVMPVGEDSLTNDGSTWKYIIINGKQVKLNCPPRYEDTTTMVPLEYYGETLGAKVTANNTTKEYIIEK